MSTKQEILDDIGPLAKFIGVWVGNQGEDVSPGVPDRMKTDIESNYREQWVFQTISPATINHDQLLRQVVCDTNAWRANPSTAGHKSGEPFHSQRGYWVWDPATKMILSSFAVPRGIVVNAGGIVEPNATEFEMVAEAGSEVYGVCQNPYLIENFKVVRFTLKLKLIDDNTFQYEQNTQLKIKGRDGIFDHTDKNTLRRIK